jgi:glycosyltransferase involved in cell wall biosynthesis
VTTGTPETAGISVIIATRNRAARLATLFDSFSRLEPPDSPFDIIVVDNGSTDGTAAEVDRLAKSVAAPVRCVSEPQAGVSHARNAGTRASTCRFVAFVDDDQSVASGWLIAATRAFEQHADIGAVCGRVLPRFASEPPGWIAGVQGAAGIIDRGPEPFLVTKSRWMCLPGGNMAWRRSTLLEIGGFSPAWRRSEDRELTVRYLLSGGTALYTPDMLTYPHIPSDRLTKRYFRSWHLTEGYMRAGFAAEELFTADGALRPIPDDVPKWLGVSTFVYRRWLKEIARSALCRLRLRPDDALRHEMQALMLTSYLRGRIEQRWAARAGS